MGRFYCYIKWNYECNVKYVSLSLNAQLKYCRAQNFYHTIMFTYLKFRILVSSVLEFINNTLFGCLQSHVWGNKGMPSHFALAHNVLSKKLNSLALWHPIKLVMTQQSSFPLEFPMQYSTNIKPFPYQGYDFLLLSLTSQQATKTMHCRDYS